MSDRPKKKIRNRREGTHEFNKATGKHRYVTEIESGRRVYGSWKENKLLASESLRDKLRALGPQSPRAPLLQDWAEACLQGNYKARLLAGDMQKKTWEQYEQCWRLRLYGTVLGETAIDVVSTDLVNGWSAATKTEAVVRRRKGTGEEYVAVPSRPMGAWGRRKDLGFLRGVMKLAVKAKWRTDNPVVDAVRPPEPKTDFRTLSPEEFDRLIARVQWYQENWNNGTWKSQSPNPRRAELMVWLLVHGMGPSEAAGVRREVFWTDKEGRPLIEVVTGARDGDATDRLKTANRRRTVPVWPQLWELVKDLGPGFVLASHGGKAIRTENLRRLWHSIIKGTEFEGMNPYDLRHTYAQALVDNGVDPRTGAELMGNTPEVFLRLYVKSDLERKHRAMEKAALVKPTPEPTPGDTFLYAK